MLICEAGVSWFASAGVSTVIVCSGSYNIHKEEKGENRWKVVTFSYHFFVKWTIQQSEKSHLKGVDCKKKKQFWRIVLKVWGLLEVKH